MKSLEAVDAVIVGSGAAGSMVAKVLAEAGQQVVVLEKGRNRIVGLGGPTRNLTTLCSNDELKSLRGFHGNDPLGEPRSFRDREDVDRTYVGPVQAIPNTVGGGTIHYDADSPRCQPDDFRMRSLYGAVEGADVQDWPLSYDELEPFYTAVEYIIGVQGEQGANPFEGRRSAPFPMPPGPPKLDGLIVAEGARKLGLHPFPFPMAINSRVYRDRPMCNDCGFCSTGCPIQAMGNSAITALQEAMLTGRCELRPDSMAYRIELDDAGRRVTSVHYFDAEGERRVQPADRVILAGNPIGTTRLLLMSSHSTFPNGIGNSSGWLGRHLTFHVISVTVGIFEKETHPYRGRTITHALADFTVNSRNESDYVRGGIVELGGSILPISVGKTLPRGPLHSLLMRQGDFWKKIATASMIAEDVPVPSNRIDLDPSVRDVYGLPVPRLTYRSHPRDLALMERYNSRLEQIVTAAGAQSVFTASREFLSGGIPQTFHMHGTARMGTDPEKSVTDPFGKFHDLENLWCADASTFVTSTAYNPTLTIQALALRCAASIVAPADPSGILQRLPPLGDGGAERGNS
ncbi:MAG: GMC family oxidoreductase [Nitrospirae bacterium]|nr:GMC family oxidoreductase [Nitrospirota bacterium]